MEPLIGGSKSELAHSDASTVVRGDHSPSLSQATATAKDLLMDVLQFRRTAGPETMCATVPCPDCAAPHLSKVASAIANGKPITFVLPAFPGKSPNPGKVLGTLPDMAERCALEFLQGLCDRIERRYSPGARIILTSDGRVFGDSVGMRDEDVSAYQEALSEMIAELGLSSLSTLNLDDIYEGSAFDQMRSRLMEEHGEPLRLIKAAIKRGNGKTHDCLADDIEVHRVYCGMTRFLVEDATFPGQELSRTAIQKECRIRAYEVVRGSRAWGNAIEELFPTAVRLSIHPQACGAKKLGIRLIEPDNWLTPWHGVAVDVGGRFVLFHRSKAESLGARLVTQSGRPSHFVLEPHQLQEAGNEA
ncbi:Pyoverdine/dityrosine biosynthesis protein [compost metagenome]